MSMNFDAMMKVLRQMTVDRAEDVRLGRLSLLNRVGVDR